MSLMIQQSNMREHNVQNSRQTGKTKQTENGNPGVELAAFKNKFYEELSNINPHGTVNNAAINISEDAFKKMKEDPVYKEQILGLIKRDWGDSYAPRNCSVLITVGSTIDDYRADSWPVNADSEFAVRSRHSFYKKTDHSKKEEQKALLEEYLLNAQISKRMKKEMAEKTYLNQIR